MEISFQDQDTGNIIRENVEVSQGSGGEIVSLSLDQYYLLLQMKLNQLKTRGTMTNNSRRMFEDHNKTRDEMIAETFIRERLPLPQLKKTINSLATQLYRPPWK